MTLTTESRAELFDGLASLLRYPDQDHLERVRGVVERLATCKPEMRELLAPLSEHVEELSINELEESYTRTFDITPDCALEVGWHLYGENYERGRFLVEMRARMRDVGITESSELPDHLGHVLEVVGRLEEEEARQLCRDHLLPALGKMREKMPAERPHACVLEASEKITRELFSIDETLTTGKESMPYFREIETLPPGCSNEFGGTS